MKLHFLVLLIFFTFSLYAQTPGRDSTDTSGTTAKTSHSTAASDTKGKKSDAISEEKTDSKSNDKVEKTENTAITLPTDPFTNWSRLISIVGLLVIMIWGLVHIFNYVKEREVFVGHNTIKLLGFVLLLPSICIITLISPNTIGGSVLATLFGTIAGYVLSRQGNDSDRARDNNTNQGNRQGGTNETIAGLKKEIEELKKENESLKK